MRIKNLTPFFHGATVTSRRPPRPDLSFVVRGTFRLAHGGVVEPVEGLDQGLMTGEVYSDDDVERAGELLYPGDFAEMKVGADLLLRGTCHAPGGAPVQRSRVAFSVGTWRKELAVVGDRRWDVGPLASKMTEPVPFTTMPLGWTRAFGGPGFAANPVGRGVGGLVLPNVEDPRDPVRRRGQTPRPAGFGPVSPTWSPRAGLAGTDYGAAYRRDRAPYGPVDRDPRWFHAAPVDQQLSGFLRGDEALAFENLHPDHPTLETRLPGLRVRAFLKDDRGAFAEVPMALDTLFADTDAGTVILCWRGLHPVREDDLADVATMLVVTERLADVPAPSAVYLERLEAFERDPTGVLAALPEGLVEVAEREEKRRRGEPVPEPDLPPGTDPVTRAIRSRFGKLVSDEQLATVQASIAQLQDAQAQARSRGADVPAVDLEQAVAAARAAKRRDPPPARTIKPGRLPDARLRARMRAVQAEVARLRDVEVKVERKIDGLDALEALPHDPRLKELDPDYEVPGPLSTDAPGPGADLQDRDLAEADLAGADLRGADLRRANLAHANLRGACLAGARLGRAILYGADLTDADLTGADLLLANAALVRAGGADLTGAKLDEAFFEDASMKGARLDGASAGYAVFTRADLTGASLVGAKLDHADLSKAKLDGARLGEASAELALFADCTAREAHFPAARLTQASFADADLTGASLVGARASSAFFLRGRLDGADLSFADLRGAHLSEASAVGARLRGANLREVRAYRADLAGADLGDANLMSADLRKAHVAGAKLTRANLHDAKLLALRGDGLDLRGANLARAVRDERR